MQDTAGFTQPLTTEDSYILKMWQEKGLGDHPTLEDIEPVAVQMMREGQVLEAAGLVLARRVDAKEEGVTCLFLTTPENAFGILLLKKTEESGY
jgi:hypothetical protein